MSSPSSLRGQRQRQVSRQRVQRRGHLIFYVVIVLFLRDAIDEIVTMFRQVDFPIMIFHRESIGDIFQSVQRIISQQLADTSITDYPQFPIDIFDIPPTGLHTWQFLFQFGFIISTHTKESSSSTLLPDYIPFFREIGKKAYDRDSEKRIMTVLSRKIGNYDKQLSAYINRFIGIIYKVT